ncbi:uncharacterized protein LOC103988764 [Musa acuminata AAA Group]|uniref:uncharacterized protein LOC103988764 n=2 Tax=Musa acuminata AAA Group TaxID=214697 RepID=UPI0031DDE3DD
MQRHHHLVMASSKVIKYHGAEVNSCCSFMHAYGLVLEQKDQELRRSYSDMVAESEKKLMMDAETRSNEVESVKCECCGMSQDCTRIYIERIKAFFCGHWVCGLCSEAVKEEMRLRPAVAMEEAMRAHMALCKGFNRSRLNPQLSLASAMRDIARKSLQHRTSDEFFASEARRTTSCKFRRASFQ